MPIEIHTLLLGKSRQLSFGPVWEPSVQYCVEFPFVYLLGVVVRNSRGNFTDFPSEVSEFTPTKCDFPGLGEYEE